MKRFQRYQEYKPSGIDWIDKIPSHWQSIKLKYLASINPTTNINVPNNIDLEFVPMENVDEKNGLIREYAFRPFEEIKNGYTPFQNEDVIFAKITPCMENGNCAIVQNLSNNIAFGSTEFIVFRSNELITKELLYYILRDKNTRKIFEINMTGSAGQKRVPTPFVANFKIPHPNLDEQKSIANFLDQKSKQIDEFIADKQALISLFEEQKKAIINDAVTKGLDKTVPLKPSGIEWIDEIPSHWEAKKLKFLADVMGSNVDKLSKENELPVFLCNYTDVYKNDVITNTIEFMEATATAEEIEKFVLRKNDVIITKDSETPDDIAVPTYVAENFTNVLCGYHLSLIRTYENLNGKFLYYLFRSKDFNIRFELHSNGVTRYGLGSWAIKNAVIPLPPLQEQQAIITHIETELAKIDTLIETAKAEINLIEEYKTSLINEAVTGKIKIHKEDVA